MPRRFAGVRFFFLPADQGGRAIAQAAVAPNVGDVPDCYWSVCRVQLGGASCSATVVADLGSGRYLLTSASHCFGTGSRDGVKITYWSTRPASDALGRPGSDEGGQGIARPRTASGLGKYTGSFRRGDFATIVADLDSPGSVAMVGVGDARRLNGRTCFTIGCPRGIWPPVCRKGTVSASGRDSRGEVIYATQEIVSGQSGGALFDGETGYLVGITNWGPMDGRRTEALFVSSWLPELVKWLPK